MARSLALARLLGCPARWRRVRSAISDLPPLAVGPHAFHRRQLENGLCAVAVRDELETVSVFVVLGVGNR